MEVRSTAARRGRTSPTSSTLRRLARSPSMRTTIRTSGSARAKRIRATTSSRRAASIIPTNGGRSWTAVPFPTAPGISRILLDPTDPKHIVVGVLGDVFGPSQRARRLRVASTAARRSPKRSTCPINPARAIWRWIRKIRTSFTPECGTFCGARGRSPAAARPTTDLYRSADGGKTWNRRYRRWLSRLRRSAVSAWRSRPPSRRVYALVESKAGVLWRSDDCGVTWKLTTKDSAAEPAPVLFLARARFADDASTVYGVSMLLAASYNGGEKFNLSAFGVHSRSARYVDQHRDGNRMALAGDGGIAISTNGGATWSNSRNIAIGTGLSRRPLEPIPYLICGGLAG